MSSLLNKVVLISHFYLGYHHPGFAYAAFGMRDSLFEIGDPRPQDFAIEDGLPAYGAADFFIYLWKCVQWLRRQHKF